MAIYLSRSLVGTDNDDVLTNTESYVGDGNTDTYLVYNSIYGLGGDDVITVVKNRDVRLIDGGSGNDTITNHTGYFGSVYGGDGNDTIDYVKEDRISHVFGNAGNDTVLYKFTEQNDVSKLNGGDGVDTLALSGLFNSAWVSNFEILKVTGELSVVGGQLSEFDRIKVGSAPINFLVKTDVSDVHFSDGAATVRLVGSDASDIFDLSDQTRNFSILGGAGADTIIAGAGRLFADGGAGVDFIEGGTGDDILKGGNSSNKTSTQLETVLGKGGDDAIYFSGTPGILDGGDGTDTLYISAAPRTATESLGGTSATNFEHLVISTSAAVPVDLTFFEQFDTVEGKNSALKFTSAVTLDHMPEITGRNVTLIGSAENDRMVTTSSIKMSLFGDKGDDVLRATTKSVILDGGAGNDTLIGSSSADTITGGAGNDSVSGGDGSDSLDGGHGLDIVRGGDGNDRLHMADLKAADHQTLYGGDGDDSFFYGSVNGSIDEKDWIFNDRATVKLVGGKGEDSLRISGNLENVEATGIESLSFYDEIWARPEFLSGFKTITAELLLSEIDKKIHLASAGVFTWSGGYIDALIYGTKGADIFDFSGSSTSMQGILLGAGDDVVRFGGGKSSESQAWGENGNDTAYSGKGMDEFSGRNGADRFIAGEGNDTFYGGLGHDVYVAAANTGVDLFDDFEAKGASSDVIDLSGISDITDFADLKANHLKTSGNEIYIDLGSHGKLFINYSLDIADLTEANFLF